MSKRNYVIGDSKGNVVLYSNNSQNPVEEAKLGKSKVTRVAALGVNLMVAAIMDQNLYLVDFSKKPAAVDLILKGAINFYYWQGESTFPKFLVISKGNKNNVHAYKLNFDAQTLQKVFDLQKVATNNLQAGISVSKSPRLWYLAQKYYLCRFRGQRV